MQGYHKNISSILVARGRRPFDRSQRTGPVCPANGFWRSHDQHGRRGRDLCRAGQGAAHRRGAARRGLFVTRRAVCHGLRLRHPAQNGQDRLDQDPPPANPALGQLLQDQGWQLGLHCLTSGQC